MKTIVYKYFPQTLFFNIIKLATKPKGPISHRCFSRLIHVVHTNVFLSKDLFFLFWSQKPFVVLSKNLVFGVLESKSICFPKQKLSFFMFQSNTCIHACSSAFYGHFSGVSPSLCLSLSYIHTCIYTYMHTYIHTYIFIHARIHTYLHINIHACPYWFPMQNIWKSDREACLVISSLIHYLKWEK